jgi:hypothetical protein
VTVGTVSWLQGTHTPSLALLHLRGERERERERGREGEGERHIVVSRIALPWPLSGYRRYALAALLLWIATLWWRLQSPLGPLHVGTIDVEGGGVFLGRPSLAATASPLRRAGHAVLASTATVSFLTLVVAFPTWLALNTFL